MCSLFEKKQPVKLTTGVEMQWRSCDITVTDFSQSITHKILNDVLQSEVKIKT